jgi:hypothetical protein
MRPLSAAATGSASSFPTSPCPARFIRNTSLEVEGGDALPTSKHELAQQQPRAKSNDQSRNNKSQDISSVERLNAGIAQGVQERENPEHQHEQTDDDPYAPLTLLPFGVACILSLA